LKFDGSNFISLEWRTAFLEKDKATWIAQNFLLLHNFEAYYHVHRSPQSLCGNTAKQQTNTVSITAGAA
jgi:hypothetical protein